MHLEVQSMLDHCEEYATDLLKETGEAYPFGAFTDTAGQVHPLEMEIDKKNVPNIGKVVEALHTYGKTELAAQKIGGYAVTYECEIQISEEEKLDCIAIDITHPAEETPLFYLPFRVSDLGVGVDELFAVKR